MAPIIPPVTDGRWDEYESQASTLGAIAARTRLSLTMVYFSPMSGTSQCVRRSSARESYGRRARSIVELMVEPVIEVLDARIRWLCLISSAGNGLASFGRSSVAGRRRYLEGGTPNAAASSSPSRAQCQTDLPPLAGSDHQHGRPAERADIGPRCTSSRLPSQKRSKATGGRAFTRARGWEIPPLPCD